jgi:flagellar motility protein MotE (MotC chaperone)
VAKMEENERSYSVMERLLFYTLPVLFTLLLTGVLLTVFGYDVVNETLRLGNKIPGVASILPDPKPTDEELLEAIREAKAEPAEEEADVPSSALSVKNAEIAQLQSSTEAKDQRIAELAAELEAARKASAQEAATEEQYTANIRQLAKVYAEMKASKAAPVLEALTLSERVLVLKEMKEDQQVKILEKMDPKMAAETSILLKDVVASKDLQIAALQERLALSGGSETPAATKLTRDEVSRTFAQMTPARAAEVLLVMAKADEAAALDILRAMEAGSRARILNSLAELDKERTAKLTAKLG